MCCYKWFSQTSWRGSSPCCLNPGEAGREAGTEFAASPLCRSTVGGLGLAGSVLLPSGKMGRYGSGSSVFQDTPGCLVRGCFYLSEHWLVLPRVLREAPAGSGRSQPGSLLPSGTTGSTVTWGIVAGRVTSGGCALEPGEGADGAK